MTKLTYIFHSCFMLETEHCVIIFDYWRDSADNTVRQAIEHTDKQVYFLASHAHEDHFNPDILSMRPRSGKQRIILSDDIKADGADARLHRQQSYSDRLISVRAFGSTDIGVSFMVEVDGKRIFHAGDLNNWHWQDESPQEEVDRMEHDFRGVLADIKAVCPAVDIAMFPVDPRLGTDFARGARQWLETIDTRMLAPMHFQQAADKAMTFGKEAERLGAEFLYIHHEGEEIATL